MFDLSQNIFFVGFLQCATTSTLDVVRIGSIYITIILGSTIS